MKVLSDCGIRQIMNYGKAMAFVLEDEKLFNPTQYKLLEAQMNNRLLPCMKMHYNGKIQLYYPVRDLKPLSNVLPSLDADSLLTVAANILSAASEVQCNGILSWNNLGLSVHHIFVEPATLQLSLLYFPVSKLLYSEEELRRNLAQMFQNHSRLSPENKRMIVDMILDVGYRLSDLAAELKQTPHSKPTVEPPRLRLVGLAPHQNVSFTINQSRFVLGKDPATADGLITFSPAVSRIHCRIERAGSRFTITDLESKNGTYVNRQRLAASCPHLLCGGDVVRLADCFFRIEIQ